MKDFNAYNEAIGYKDGLMYYNIPIEHLNNAATTTDAENKRVIPVAKYGIVRNHHYVVTVNSLTKIGKGIFDPEEEIVPGKNDEKDTYYVGARINILSWKIVNQNVNL
ncbi:Mfa1 fimbrilin C-terminal domain-containing protein [Alistipes sp. DJF_B185]